MAAAVKVSSKHVLDDIKRSVRLIGQQKYLPYPDKSFLNRDVISWSRTSGSIYKGNYADIFSKITSEQDYSFGVGRIQFEALEDPGLLAENIPPVEEGYTGLFQFYYEFSKSGLVNARIAFFPDSSKWNNFMRVDLDLKNGGKESHSECHFQISQLEEMRIPLMTLPPPSAFIEFCTRHFFPELHGSIFKDLCVHDQVLEGLFIDKKALRGITVGYQRY